MVVVVRSISHTFHCSCREVLPSDLGLIVGEFETFLSEQKKTTDQMSKFSDSSMKEVSEKASLQLQVGREEQKKYCSG